MYENQTFSVILQRLLGNVEADVDKSDGSLVYDALAPVAMELEQAYIEMDEILNRGFAQTSYENYLDMRCTEFGITRKQGTAATGQVLFSGSNNTVIPANAIVQTDSGLQYVTQADVIITNGTAMANIVATDIGTIYNVPANAINSLPVSITGVSSVTNNSVVSGGTEIETDDSLLQRLILKVQEPSTSGNIANYIEWATSVPGVGNAKVVPQANGPGTVEVIIIDSNGQPATNTLVNAVSANIEANRPIGATVTVISAIAAPINISVIITRDSNYSNTQITTDISSKIKDYLRTIAWKQRFVSYAQIGSLILGTAGVTDYASLMVNEGTVNVEITNDEVPMLGTVIVNG